MMMTNNYKRGYTIRIKNEIKEARKFFKVERHMIEKSLRGQTSGDSLSMAHKAASQTKGVETSTKLQSLITLPLVTA